MSAIFGLALVVLVLWFIYSKLSRHPVDPAALFVYAIIFTYVYREAVLAFGWDVPYPDFLFPSGSAGQLSAKAALALALFLVSFAIVYLVVEPHAGGLVRLAPAAWVEPNINRHKRLVYFLTGVATLVSIVLLGRYGGVDGMIRAGKRTGGLAGLYELRIFPSIGAIMAAALSLSLWQRRGKTGRRTPAIVAGLLAFLNAGYVFLWGSRTAVGAVFVVFFVGQWLLRRDGRPSRDGVVHRARKPRVTMIIAIVALLISAVIGLRVYRDFVIGGGVAGSLQGQSKVRQLSVSTNSFAFDSMMLALRDWPASHPYREGKDFIVGIEGMVPRKLWPGKPANVRVGSWFRQVYEPGATNGWGLGAVGDWYLEFGILGLIVGGGLSGAAFGALSAAWWRSAWTPVTLAAITCFVITVVPTGINALSTLRWIQWGAPLLLCTMYLNRGARAREPEAVPRLELETAQS